MNKNIEQLQLSEGVLANLTRFRGISEQVGPRGFFGIQLIRAGKTIVDQLFPNTITNLGKNSWLDVYFRNQTQLPNWYIGLVDNSGWTAFDAADTMSSHAGWTEFTTYSQANRVAWGVVAAASQSITNTTAATFDITGSATLKGIFVTSNNTKGGTTGTLWTGAAFASTVPVVNGDQLKVTYTVNT